MVNGKNAAGKSNAMQHHFLAEVLAAPARRALEAEKINSLDRLLNYTEKELLQMHGFGKSSIKKLKLHLAQQNLILKP